MFSSTTQQETTTHFLRSLTGVTQPRTHWHTQLRKDVGKEVQGWDKLNQSSVRFRIYAGTSKCLHKRLECGDARFFYSYNNGDGRLSLGADRHLLSTRSCMNRHFDQQHLFLIFWMYCTCSVKQSQGVRFSTDHNRNCIVIEDLKTSSHI